MVDEVVITIKAGGGGDGRVSFRRLKFVPKGGPDGGDGGDGGSVFFVGNKDMNTLRSFKGTKEYRAENGEAGKKSNQHGKDGKDIFVQVPLGTVVLQNGEVCTEILLSNERVLIAKGGKGGRGNTFFKSSTNTTPRTAELGKKTEEIELKLELKLLANIGLVGLPNAGKSTLLSVLTNAKPTIANYPFTTLSPNLGVMIKQRGEKVRSFVLADIPGLIEGAHKGKGLGHAFLRHIERCSVLLYVLYIDESTFSNDSSSAYEKALTLITQYQLLKKELAEFNAQLMKKKEIVGVNKIDLYSKELREEILHVFEKQGIQPILFSSASTEGIDTLRMRLFENR